MRAARADASPLPVRHAIPSRSGSRARGGAGLEGHNPASPSSDRANSPGSERGRTSSPRPCARTLSQRIGAGHRGCQRVPMSGAPLKRCIRLVACWLARNELLGGPVASSSTCESAWQAASRRFFGAKHQFLKRKPTLRDRAQLFRDTDAGARALERQLTAVDPRDRAAVSELLNPPTERERKRAARVKLALDTALLGDHRLRTQLVASTGFSVRAVRMRSDLAACVVTWGCYPGARPRAEAALGALRGRVKWAAARLMQGRSMPDLAFCFDENDEVAARAEAEAEEAQKLQARSGGVVVPGWGRAVTEEESVAACVAEDMGAALVPEPWGSTHPPAEMLAMGLRIEDARLVRDLAPWQLKTLHEAVIDGNEGQGQEQRGQGGGGGTTMLAEIVAGRKRLHGALASIAKAEGVRVLGALMAARRAVREAESWDGIGDDVLGIDTNAGDEEGPAEDAGVLSRESKPGHPTPLDRDDRDAEAAVRDVLRGALHADVSGELRKLLGEGWVKALERIAADGSEQRQGVASISPLAIAAVRPSQRRA